MGRREQLAALRQGTLAWNAWRHDNLHEPVNLSRTSQVDRTLRDANLVDANLVCADLSNADLRGANLSGADLRGAHLQGADLRFANLTDAQLDGARCDGVTLNRTVLADVQLESLCAGPVVHEAASTIDHRSILRSIHVRNLLDFLIASGMPNIVARGMIDMVQSVDPSNLKSIVQSTFISYGTPDHAFAEKLNNELVRGGVTTFFFPNDAPPGARLHRVMREGVNRFDRIVLICSRDSLNRSGVVNEIQEVLSRESRDAGAEYLIPVTIDDYLFKDWGPADGGVRQAILDRVVADFRGTDASTSSDPAAARAKFSKQVTRLLGALRGSG